MRPGWTWPGETARVAVWEGGAELDLRPSRIIMSAVIGAVLAFNL